MVLISSHGVNIDVGILAHPDEESQIRQNVRPEF